METIIKNSSLDLKNSAISFMFAYAEQDIDKMMSLCDTEGEVWFLPLGEGGRGKIGELGKNIWSALIDCFPDITNSVDSATMTPEGDVRCQVMISGTQAKDFADIPSKGFKFGSDHVFIFHHNSDGIINKIHISWNHSDLKHQLGS